MKFQKYTKYKASGVDWLWEIPEEWEVKRIKDLSLLLSGKTITSNELVKNGKYPVYGGGGLRGYTSSYTNNGNYILIGRQGALCGNIKFAIGKFWASEHSIVVYTKPLLNTSWYKNLLVIMNLNQYSISSAQPGLSVEKLTRLSIPYINKQTQTKIANYLDEKTNLIDKKISLLQKKKQRYKELKQTLINEVVTKGLDKNVKMKNSEIEWIGEIPEHWEVKRLKDIFIERVEKNKQANGKPLTKNILSVMKDVGVINHRDKGLVGNKMSEDISNYKIVHIDDIVVNKMNVMIGSVGISKEFGALSVIYIILKTRNFSHPKYYDYLFKIKIFQRNLRRISTGILEIREAVNMILFNGQNLQVPPKQEQIQIANYLDEKTKKIDDIMEKIDENIATLKEFRKTLINDAVTGKIKVA